jgi:hypothetical protein
MEETSREELAYGIQGLIPTGQPIGRRLGNDGNDKHSQANVARLKL